MSAKAILALGAKNADLSLSMSLLRVSSASLFLPAFICIKASSRSLAGTPGWSGYVAMKWSRAAVLSASVVLS